MQDEHPHIAIIIKAASVDIFPVGLLVANGDGGFRHVEAADATICHFWGAGMDSLHELAAHDDVKLHFELPPIRC